VSLQPLSKSFKRPRLSSGGPQHILSLGPDQAKPIAWPTDKFRYFEDSPETLFDHVAPVTIRADGQSQCGWNILDQDPSLGTGSAKTHKTLTEKTLARLRRDIVSGEFKAGHKVKSEDLKRRYQVGTSPIREALFQLVSEGLVSADGQRGFRVAELRQEELLDIADWRARLECEALRRAVANGDMEWETRVVAASHRLKGVERQSGLDHRQAADLWEDHHRAFHFALYSACGSAWLLRFCALLLQHGERYRRAYIAYPTIPVSISEEHQAIMEAALTRNADLAVSLLEKHIRHAAELARSHAAKPKGASGTNRGASATKQSRSPAAKKGARKSKASTPRRSGARRV
jgi:DNA-binding GntR family transcriptional regulator